MTESEWLFRSPTANLYSGVFTHPDLVYPLFPNSDAYPLADPHTNANTHSRNAFGALYQHGNTNTHFDADDHADFHKNRHANPNGNGCKFHADDDSDSNGNFDRHCNGDSYCNYYPDYHAPSRKAGFFC